MFVEGRDEADEVGNFAVRRNPVQTMWTHNAFCDALPAGHLDEYARDPRIQQLFLKQNVTQKDVIGLIKSLYHVDVVPSFVSRLKDRVIDVMAKEDEIDNAKFIPVLQDLTQRNREAAAYIETKDGGEASITAKTASNSYASMDGKKLMRAFLVMPWSNRIAEDRMGPAVIALDSARTHDGTRVSVIPSERPTQTFLLPLRSTRRRTPRP